MTTQKAKYAVLGNLPNELAQEISTAVEIHPPTSAVEDIHGLFIHGPTATPDLATLEHHLKAGKMLTFHQPTDEHLSHLLKLVGYAPASGIPIVSCYRNAATQSSTVFQTLQTTYGIGFRPNTLSYAPDNMGTVALITAAVAPHLTSAQTILKNGVPPRQGLLPLIPGYTGQQWGTLRVFEALDNGTLALMAPKMPSSTNEWDTCDKNWKYGENPQPGTALMHYSDYYVYWANGDDGTGNGPYYCLIRVDGGYFTAGKPGGRAYVSDGYESGLFQLYPVNLTIDPSTGPNSNVWTVIPLGQSPGASQPNSDGTDPQIPVYAPDLSLTFNGSIPGKSNTNWQWNVGKDSSGQPVPVDTLQLPGWGVDYAFDNSIVFHQVDQWNPYLFPWQNCDWGVFWTAYINPDNSACIKPIGSSQSRGRVPFSSVSSWLVKCPIPQISSGGNKVPEVPPYPTQPCVVDMLPSLLADNNPSGAANGLNTLWHYMAFTAHSSAGCTVSQFHFWFQYYYGCYALPSQNSAFNGDTLDLQAIVNHTAFSQT